MSLKDKIKSVQDIKREGLFLPEWNENIEIRTMTAAQRASLFITSIDAKGEIIRDKFQVGLVIASCFDPETGERVFDPSDADWLMNKAAGPINAIAKVAMRLSGLSEEVSKELEKNS